MPNSGIKHNIKVALYHYLLHFFKKEPFVLLFYMNYRVFSLNQSVYQSKHCHTLVNSRHLDAELDEMEARMREVHSSCVRNMALMDEFNSRMKNLLGQIDSVAGWLQQAQKLLQQLLELNLSPEERVQRTEALRATLKEKMDHLDNIQLDAERLLQMDGPSSGLEYVSFTMKYFIISNLIYGVSQFIGDVSIAVTWRKSCDVEDNHQ